MLQSLLISLAKELVFEGLLAVLRDQAKKTDTPLDDSALDYLQSQKSELMAALSKAF